MIRVFLGGLVTVTSLSACGASQVNIPASVDAQAQDCYLLVLQDSPTQPPDMQAPIPLEDGTLLVQWQVSDINYGSCQVDSNGSVLMLTQVSPTAAPSPTEAAESAPATANP
ncbi:MAG: hypothetical protein AAFU71_10070 [Cyanobacteria bacterium J06632_22]